MTTGTTRIRNVAWAIVWDADTKRQTYARDIDFVFTDNRIVFVGRDYGRQADRDIDGSQLCLMPGLVNVHTHLMAENLGRGLIEELGNTSLYMSGLYDEKAPFLATNMTFDATDTSAALNAAHVSTQIAIGELLKSGVTTVVDLAVNYDGWLDILANTGIRAYAAPMFRQARWRVPTGSYLEFAWDEEKGRRDFSEALGVVDAARRHPSGRLDGMIAPAQIDTCKVDLLQDSLKAARERGMKLTIHCAQSVAEFQEIVRRHGVTPIEWLDSIGMLNADVILGHAIFLDHHSWVHWGTRRDLDTLAASGASVAHCPVVFSRYGQAMESIGSYIRKGINVALGCDTEPHNMIEEMRMALTLGRLSSRNIRGIELGEIFNAATVGGANALGRPDLGRLAVGAKADFVTIDLDRPEMMPVRDPLRSLVFTAADRAIRDVYIDGRIVVEKGKVLTIDMLEMGRAAERIQSAIIANAPRSDQRGRTADQISPRALPLA